MECNKSRGVRTLLWMKVTFALTVLVGVIALAALFVATGNNVPVQQFTVDNPNIDAAMNVLAWIVVLVFGGFSLAVSWSIYQLFWLMWLYRITKNLGKVTHVAFGPWVAVICSMIPYVGLIIHYFIFKNLVKSTEEFLDSHRNSPSKTAAEILLQVHPVDRNFVNGFVIMAVLGGTIGFIRDTSISGILTVVFSLASILCYMKSFAAFIKEEQAMYEIYQDDKLRAKVDQVLWERELEKNNKDHSNTDH